MLSENYVKYGIARRLDWQEAGLCNRCGNEEPLPGRLGCKDCIAKQTVWTAKRRKLCTKKGICSRCFKNPIVDKTSVCRACQVKTGQKFKARRDKQLALIVSHYGGKCACCGETKPKFLTLDHTDDDGGLMRKIHGYGTKLYSWIIKNEFPTNLQLMCYNCNCGRYRNGGICPHQERDSIRGGL